MAESAAHMIAHGRVQGVGFRFFVREQASVFGVTGWVKNLYDGTVEIHVEGEKDVVNNFIEKIKKGPMFGLVSELTVNWIEPTGTYSNFSIQF
ncbi:acylphosphatase [Candidatus Latescibacterota bacterium]